MQRLQLKTTCLMRSRFGYSLARTEVSSDRCRCASALWIHKGKRQTWGWGYVISLAPLKVTQVDDPEWQRKGSHGFEWPIVRKSDVAITIRSLAGEELSLNLPCGDKVRDLKGKVPAGTEESVKLLQGEQVLHDDEESPLS